MNDCPPRGNKDWTAYCRDNPGCFGCNGDGTVNWGDLTVVTTTGGTAVGPAERKELEALFDQFKQSGNPLDGLAFADRLRGLGFEAEAISAYGDVIRGTAVSQIADVSILARAHLGQGRAFQSIGQMRAAEQAFVEYGQLERLAGMLSQLAGQPRGFAAPPIDGAQGVAGGI